MNQQKVKRLRKQFEAYHGSSFRDSESYKYHWRLFKKTISKVNKKNYKNGGVRV